MAVGTKVQFSQVTRAMWALLLDVEGVMEGVRALSLKHPSYGNTADFAEFESELSAYLLDLFYAVEQDPRQRYSYLVMVITKSCELGYLNSQHLWHANFMLQVSLRSNREKLV